MIKKSIFILSVFVVFGIVLSGCMGINPYTGEKEVSRTAIGAGAGAAGGAILGGLIGGGRGVAIGAAAGGVTGGVVGNIMDRQRAELRRELQGTGVQVKQVGNDIQLVMASDVTFKTDSADINSRFYPPLNSVAKVVKKYSATNLIVSGYTDSTGTAVYNQKLSEQRAHNVGTYLISQGVNKNRIFTQGFGERYPVASNATAQSRYLNRRVVITLRPKG